MNTFTVDGYTAIVRSDDAVFAKYGVPTEVPAALLDKITGEEFPVIFVTSGFSSLSSASQNAILTHEIGHIACGHLDKYNEEGVLYDIPELEAEADAWAAGRVGHDTFLESLDETVSILLTVLGSRVTSEMKEELFGLVSRRKELLQNYM